ncbi:MAG: glycosyltransferase family 4 protein [Candidatus Desulfofervidus auxilii]|nr:glycosyltransferase family 4 protein [Candidatus Desulfofervidus auxilii]
MKIAVIGTRGFPRVQGGVEKHCEELYPRLVKLGCKVLVFTRTPYIPFEKRLKEWKGVSFFHLWCPRKKSFEAITHTFLAVLLAKKWNPDILHIHAIGPSLMVPLARALGFKIVMTHHGPDYERAKWGKLAKKVLKIGEKWGVAYSTRIIAISKGIKEHIKIKFGKEAIFIPNGVYIPKIISSGEELRRWELKPKGYVFTACRFVPEKGLHDLIEAYRKLKNPPFKLVIAGDADHETSYSRKLKKIASETPGVVLTGFVSGKRLGELFSNAGLFVLPSYYEGLPIALLEALSYGLPVLVSDIPQHRELPLENYRYFQKGNIADLSKKMVELFDIGISEKEKRKYISLIQNEYNWDKIAEKTLKVYEEVL